MGDRVTLVNLLSLSNSIIELPFGNLGCCNVFESAKEQKPTAAVGMSVDGVLVDYRWCLDTQHHLVFGRGATAV